MYSSSKIRFHEINVYATELKQEDQMVKQSIFAILTGLLCSHLAYIIIHCKGLGYSVPVNNIMVSCNPVTLSEGQGHSKLNQSVSVEYSNDLHHTKFETN